MCLYICMTWVAFRSNQQARKEKNTHNWGLVHTHARSWISYGPSLPPHLHCRRHEPSPKGMAAPLSPLPSCPSHSHTHQAADHPRPGGASLHPNSHRKKRAVANDTCALLPAPRIESPKVRIAEDQAPPLSLPPARWPHVTHPPRGPEANPAAFLKTPRHLRRPPLTLY